MLIFATSVTHSVSYRDGEDSNVQGFMAHSVLKYSLLILISVDNNNFLGLWHIYWGMISCRKLHFELVTFKKILMLCHGLLSKMITFLECLESVGYAPDCKHSAKSYNTQWNQWICGLFFHQAISQTAGSWARYVKSY